MNPNMVAVNRTARLAREAVAPVYTTRTGDRPQWQIADEAMMSYWLVQPSDYYDCRCGDC